MSIQIIVGDCLAQLKTLPDESVDCGVTSPPYWGLRDYGVEGQMGLEETLGEHLKDMVAVFEEFKRVLKSTGTLWVNYGDCYATTPNGRSAAATKAVGNDDRTFRDKPFSTIGGVLKPKDLCMIPNRFAIAMQESGWWVRSEIIWAKPNPMPESVKDRPAGSHEKIFLFSKQPQYNYNGDAVTQPVSKNTHARLSQDIMAQIGSARANGGKKTNGNMKAVARKQKNLKRDRPHSMHKARVKDNDSFDSALALPVTERNLRNYEPAPLEVWNIPTAAYSEAHFATFPPELAKRCILAGCPKGGMVLDMFGGAGTTGLVADRLGRDCILLELNPEYAEMAKARISNDSPLFAEVS
ncbi:site-specific DNA-methyltransferase [Lentilitoribacter sp. Alg239-R112]|uniref:DNA-methyltransferase n=1 Tax=Lentilitoribacter sp. Alg239-R112 TaxID=2305987 RepID=UPI0013A6AB9D|nr:site-specific DNA-methyltransferase [Lentilitoribacter sp. Alg239-R112]